MPDDKNYKVGFGKPPLHGRFKKGCSGNPTGRAKGSRNSTTLLDQTLNEKVAVTVKGRRKRITKREAIIKLAVNKMLSGDIKFIRFLRELSPQVLLEAEKSVEPPPEPNRLSPREHLIRAIAALKILYDAGALPAESQALFQEMSNTSRSRISIGDSPPSSGDAPSAKPK